MIHGGGSKRERIETLDEHRERKRGRDKKAKPRQLTRTTREEEKEMERG